MALGPMMGQSEWVWVLTRAVQHTSHCPHTPKGMGLRSGASTAELGHYSRAIPFTAVHATASGTFNPLCRVLCTIRSLYLYAIGSVAIFSLPRDTPGF